MQKLERTYKGEPSLIQKHANYEKALHKVQASPTKEERCQSHKDIDQVSDSQLAEGKREDSQYSILVCEFHIQ